MAILDKTHDLHRIAAEHFKKVIIVNLDKRGFCPRICLQVHKYVKVTYQSLKLIFDKKENLND